MRCASLISYSAGSSTGDVAPAEVLSSLGTRVEADLAQLLAKFFALVVLIKLEEGIEGGRWHAINRLCEPIQDCGRFQIPLVGCSTAFCLRHWAFPSNISTRAMRLSPSCLWSASGI